MRTLTVTLPDPMVEEIEARGTAGDYASESDVVRDSVDNLFEPYFELDEHRIAEIRASCDGMEADPSLGIPVDEIMDRVRRKALSTGGLRPSMSSSVRTLPRADLPADLRDIRRDQGRGRGGGVARRRSVAPSPPVEGRPSPGHGIRMIGHRRRAVIVYTVSSDTVTTAAVFARGRDMGPAFGGGP